MRNDSGRLRNAVDTRGTHMAQHITVTEYDPEWPARYEAEKQRIVRILGDNCVAVYHIGSTSVPGLAAKPVIDIMAAVKSLEQVDAAAEEFSGIGYEYLGEFGIEGRRYLRKGGDERTHQIHIFRADDWDNIGRHLAFRDFMRTHGRERDEYAEIKRALAQRFPYDIDGYCDGKDGFVREMEERALSWYDGSWERLYLAAGMVRSPGGVSAALLSDDGEMYTGTHSPEVCAERNAIADMITDGGSGIDRIVIMMPDGSVGMPCGACRELMMRLDASVNTKILRDYETKESVRLRDPAPEWWR